MRTGLMALACLGIVLLAPASADNLFVVAPSRVSDEKAVFATVESPRIVPARARIEDRAKHRKSKHRRLRIPAKATSRSDAWRPPIPIDGDQVARVRKGAVGCMS